MEDQLIDKVEIKKKWLKRYKKYLECVTRLNDKLENLESKIIKIKSPNYSGMPKGGTPITVEDLICDKDELEERIARLKQSGRNIRREILNEIDRLDDVRYCDVLEMYFIDNLSFDDIADHKGYNDKSVIRIYSKAIRELVRLDELEEPEFLD